MINIYVHIYLDAYKSTWNQFIETAKLKTNNNNNEKKF
jgi:hypothetical protein